MNLDPLQLLLVVIAALIAHVTLMVTARKLNPMMMVIAAYFVFAPMSAATDFPGFTAFKYARLYCSLLIVIIGVFLMRVIKPRPAGLVFLLWVLYYWACALYGPNVVQGITLKGMYVLVVVSGLVAAYGLRSISDFRVGLRVLLVGSGFFAIVLVYEMATNPSAVTSIGRLTAFGLNPSRIGQECAPMIICASAVAFYDRSKLWRLAAYAIAAVLALASLSSGSRGGVFMAGIGVFGCAVPLIRRPVLLAFTALVVYAVGSLIISVISPEVAERLGDMSYKTRAAEWAKGWAYFHDSPMIGQGWVMDEQARQGGGTRNMHSAYMQVLSEQGIVGCFFFGCMLIFVLWRGFMLYLHARGRPADRPYIYFTLGLLGALLAHCTAESSTLMGSNINGLMLPFSIGLIDRLRELLAKEQTAAEAAAAAQYDYDYAEQYGYGDDPPALPAPLPTPSAS